MTRRQRGSPILDLEVREQSLLAFRRNLGALRALWLRGDLEDLPEAVAAADHLLHVLAFVPVAGTPELGARESDPQELLQKARLRARQEGLVRLAQDTLKELEGLLGDLCSSRDAIRDEMALLDRADQGIPHRIDRIA